MENKYNLARVEYFAEPVVFEEDVPAEDLIDHYGLSLTGWDEEVGSDESDPDAEKKRDVKRRLIGHITRIIDNGGIDKGPLTPEDCALYRLIVYDKNDTEVYCIEWYDGERDTDPDNEDFYSIFYMDLYDAFEMLDR